MELDSIALVANSTPNAPALPRPRLSAWGSSDVETNICDGSGLETRPVTRPGLSLTQHLKMVNLRRIRRLRCPVPFPSRQLAVLLDASDTPDSRHVAETGIAIHYHCLAIEVLPKEGGSVLASSSPIITSSPAILHRPRSPSLLDPPISSLCFAAALSQDAGVVATAACCLSHASAVEAGEQLRLATAILILWRRVDLLPHTKLSAVLAFAAQP